LVNAALGRSTVGRPRYRDLLRVRLVGLRLQLVSGGVVIATWDSDPRPPRFGRPASGHYDEGELHFVPMLAEAWDFFPSDGGKVVWCEVRIPPVGDQRLPHRTQTTATTSRIPSLQTSPYSNGCALVCGTCDLPFLREEDQRS